MRVSINMKNFLWSIIFFIKLQRYFTFLIKEKNKYFFTLNKDFIELDR